MINDRLIWIKQICAEVEALRKGAGVSYASGCDPLAQLREEWKRGSYTEGDEYPEYPAPLLEQLEFLTLRYEGYAYTSQILEAAANAIRNHADQLKQAKIDVLREAIAMWSVYGLIEGTAVQVVRTEELNRMADEIERSKT